MGSLKRNAAPRRRPATNPGDCSPKWLITAQNSCSAISAGRWRLALEKTITARGRCAPDAGQRSRVQLQGITHVVEADAMRQLGIGLAHDMTPRTECARLILSTRRPGQLRNRVLRNDIADLPQGVELGTCWLDLLFFHPCLVAGLHGRANTFFVKTVGWL